MEEQTQAVQLIDVDLITPMPNNVRLTADTDQQKELNESVRQHGILQAVTVRRYNGKYELIAGARRLAAAKSASLASIPCVIVEADDQSAREINITENILRENLHPMEEAHGLAELLKSTAKQTAGAGAPDALSPVVAKRLGKPAGWVRRRLKLLDLTPAWQKLFAERKIGIEVAELVCRHTAQDQEKIWNRRGQWGDGKDRISVSELRQWINENLMLELKRAPFELDDATLLSKHGKVFKGWGACTNCQFRTKNSSDLFGDVKGDICTRGACYQEKVQATIDRKFDEAKADKRTVLPIATESYHAPKGSIYASSESWRDGARLTKSGACKSVEEGIIVHADQWDGKNDIGKTVYICRDKNCKVHFGGRMGDGRGVGKMTPAQKKARAKVILANKVDRAARPKVFAALIEAAKDYKIDGFRFLVGEIYDRFVRHQDGAAVFLAKGWPTSAGRWSTPSIEGKLKEMKTPNELFSILALMPIAEEWNPEGSNGRTTRLARFSKAFGVDMKGIYQAEEKAIVAARVTKKKGAPKK